MKTILQFFLLKIVDSMIDGHSQTFRDGYKAGFGNGHEIGRDEGFIDGYNHAKSKSPKAEYERDEPDSDTE